MDYLADNSLALVALLVSLATAGVQVSNWRRGRHRVTLTCQEQTIGTTDPHDGKFANHRYIVATVRNAGRPCSVDSLTFERRRGRKFEVSGLSWGPAPHAVSNRLTDNEIPPGYFTQSRLVDDGDSVSWPLRVMSSEPDGHYEPIEIRAVAALSTGQTVRSKPI